MEFDGTTYNAIFDKADSVWVSNSATTTVVLALASMSSPLEEATEVATISKKGKNKNKNGKSRNGGGGNGNNSGGSKGQSGSGWGPRHPDNPPSSACLVHWKFGKGAWMCIDRHNCLWRDFESPRPRHNRNIVAVAEKVDWEFDKPDKTDHSSALDTLYNDMEIQSPNNLQKEDQELKSVQLGSVLNRIKRVKNMCKFRRRASLTTNNSKWKGHSG